MRGNLAQRFDENAQTVCTFVEVWLFVRQGPNNQTTQAWRE